MRAHVAITGIYEGPLPGEVTIVVVHPTEPGQELAMVYVLEKCPPVVIGQIIELVTDTPS